MLFRFCKTNKNIFSNIIRIRWFATNVKFVFFYSDVLGEKKLDKVAAPDVWKTGARNIMGGKDGGRTVGGNKLLEKKTYR